MRRVLWLLLAILLLGQCMVEARDHSGETESKGGKKGINVVGIIVFVVLAIAAIACCCFCAILLFSIVPFTALVLTVVLILYFRRKKKIDEMNENGSANLPAGEFQSE